MEKSIKISHRKILLKTFTDENKANLYLERLKDPTYLKNETTAARKIISENLEKSAKKLTAENKKFLNKK